MEGERWYRGEASCILVGNVGKLFGGVEVFEDSHDDDGLLEVGVLAASGAVATARTMARVAVKTVDDAAHARTTKASRVEIRLRPQGALRDRRGRPREGAVAARSA